MKLRWTRQSVRFRISPTEMARLLDNGTVSETLTFPGIPDGAGWSATLAPGDETRLEMEKGNLRLTLSPSDRKRLASPEAEGVYFENMGLPASIRYYVEKDFPCAHPGAPEAREPASETFAPPPGFKERHGGGTACE